MPPMPPPPGITGEFLLGSSATIASAVMRKPATDAAPCSAARTTLVGSMMPLAIMFTYSPVCASSRKQRNSRKENEAVKVGKTTKEWQKNPAKNRQKDKDARWTKKHGKSFYGYKNHVNVDAKHKLIRHYEVTDASVHDSWKFYGLLNKANRSTDVYADSAYRSAATEAKLKVRGLRSRVCQRVSRTHELFKTQENANYRKSKVRARIEHVFGAQQTSQGGRIVRTIGIVRAKAKIGLQNFAYKHRRFVTLERMVAASRRSPAEASRTRPLAH